MSQYRIAAMCSSCSIIYDATRGLHCPACHSHGPGAVAWAMRQDLHGTQRTSDVHLHESTYVDWSKHDEEIRWCQNLWELKDDRA